MARTRAIAAKNWDQVTIRLPPGMRDTLNELAARNGRSANAEIVARLERSLSADDSPEIEAIRNCIRTELARILESRPERQ
jgi:plasmid stability protein